MDFVKKLFSQPAGREADPNYSTDIEAIENKLTHLPEPQAKYLASFALLLARVAHIDFNVSDGEKKRIAEILRKDSHLTAEHAEIVLSIALSRVAKQSVEEHIVIRHINSEASRDQKKDVIRALFHVASESDISEQESEEIFLIAKGMNFSRQEFLELRNEFRDHLSLFK